MAGAGSKDAFVIAMGRASRDMSRFLNRRRDRQIDRASRHESWLGQPPLQRVHFPCFVMCGECGYLVTRAGGSCPACDAVTWMDLADCDIVESIRDAEVSHRLKSPDWIKALTAGLTGAAFVAPLILTGGAPIAIGAALLGAPLTYVVSLRPLSVLLGRLASPRPYRWRLPLPLPGKRAVPERVVTGEAVSTGAKLRAPFTGRECLAYQVSVLFDTAGDARPPEWVLQESVAVDFEVDGTRIAGERTHLIRALEPVDDETLEAADLDLQQFMRERGLFLNEGRFDLFEARVEAGDTVSAKLFSEPTAVEVQ